MKRKNIYVVLFLTLIIFFSISADLSQVKAYEAYDSYECDIPWKEEKQHLYGLAVFLQEHSNYIGYIAFYTGEKESSQKIEVRVNRAKKFLVSKLKVDKNRIIIVNTGKKLDKSWIILQPSAASETPPTF